MLAVRVLGIGALAALLFGISCGRRAARPVAEAPGTPRLQVRREIERVIESGSSGLDLADPFRAPPLWDRVAGFYRGRGHRPVWSEKSQLRPEAGELIEAIAHARGLGLDPEDYQGRALERSVESIARHDSASDWLRPRALARFDVRATYAFLRLADDLRHGALPGDTLDPDWSRTGEDEFRTGLLEHLGRENPRMVLADLEPRSEDYRRLKSVLAFYQAIAASGGWATLPPGPAIERGARGSRVGTLIRRLAATGDLRGPVADTVMNDRIMQAVGEFQSRHGIPRSGIVGEATRAALNVPVGRRIRSIELNLERWRWLPADLGDPAVMVNIPAYRLDFVRGGRIVRSMRAVVGRRRSPTPVFSSTIRYLELNPTWTLPVSIVFKELIPAMNRHPDYLAANHMFVVSLAGDRRDTLDPRLVPWKKMTPDSFPYLVVQSAGASNPLGRIKLMCPNEYDVYLHDTSQRERFSDAARDYSHGCVRVADAIELADSLIGFAKGKPSPLDSLASAGVWKRIRLTRPTPVHFLYWTAWADSGGRVNFRDDVYGLDERLDQALRAPGGPAFALNPGVSLSPFWLAAQQQARAIPRAIDSKSTRRPIVRPRVEARAADRTTTTPSWR